MAVTRGGLIPAGIIARELNIRHIDTACIMLYNYREEGDQETVLKSADPSFNSEETLVIDDLVDTGHTAKILRDMLPKAHFATLYAKPAGIPSWTASSPSSVRTPGCCSPGIPKCSTPSPSLISRKATEELSPIEKRPVLPAFFYFRTPTFPGKGIDSARRLCSHSPRSGAITVFSSGRAAAPPPPITKRVIMVR